MMTGRRLWGVWLCIVVSSAIAPPYDAETTPEYQVKAAFVLKFAAYIHWPVARDASPFVIGVLGANPFGGSLQDVGRNKAVQGRPIHVRALSRAEDALACDLVFISSSERESLEKIFDTLARAPVLTIGDSERFAGRGGMIGLTTTPDRHVRFEINKGAMDRAGLRASSQLLQLARIVDDERGRE